MSSKGAVEISGERGSLREHPAGSSESPSGPHWGVATGLLTLVALTVVLPVLGGGEWLRALVEGAGPWAPVAYVAAKASATIVAPLGGMPLKAASGALFGLAGGIVYSVLGDIIGGCVCFWATRYLGRGVVERLAGPDGIARVDELARRSGGWRAVLFGRLFLSSVYNLVSLAAGLISKLSFWQYLAVTAFAGVFHTSFLVILGASVVLDWKMRLVAYAGIAVLAVLALLGRRRLLERGL